MAGFNQRGPMNEGPMTGRGRGICTGAVDPDQGVARRNNTMGYGMGRGRGRNRNFSQSPGWGRGAGQWNLPVTEPDPVARDTWQDRANRLEAELAAVKQQLRELSESKG